MPVWHIYYVFGPEAKEIYSPSVSTLSSLIRDPVFLSVILTYLVHMLLSIKVFRAATTRHHSIEGAGK